MKAKDTDKIVSKLSKNDEKHFSDYLIVLKRRKWVVIFLLLFIVGSVAIVSLATPPKFEAKAQILLGGQPTPMNPLGESSQRLPEINLHYQTQVKLLSSRALARKVIEGL